MIKFETTNQGTVYINPEYLVSVQSDWRSNQVCVMTTREVHIGRVHMTMDEMYAEAARLISEWNQHKGPKE